MAKATLKTLRLQQPLRTPYRLSFGTLDTFETVVVVLEANARRGLGEATPLPGYSDETVGSVIDTLSDFRASLNRGEPYSEAAPALVARAPIVASALVCAMETLAIGEKAAFEDAVPQALPLSALCDGPTPAQAADRARYLQKKGYSHLKLKAGGGDVAADIARMRAVTDALDGVSGISIDANQRLSFEDASALCLASENRPVVLIEQPFPPPEWDAFSRLAAETPVPLMLDESIWAAEDIDRAAEVGAQWVKLKLCKHPGLAANHDLIARARANGLNVVYGNGVQGALGNHLEARIYAGAALDTPGEFNGVLKIATDPFDGDFTVANGRLHAGGLRAIDDALAGAELLDSFMFTL